MRSEYLPFSKLSTTDADIAVVTEVLRSGWITISSKATEFEEKFWRHTGCQGAVVLSIWLRFVSWLELQSNMVDRRFWSRNASHAI